MVDSHLIVDGDTAVLESERRAEWLRIDTTADLDEWC
jgi:hypothetical protein